MGEKVYRVNVFPGSLIMTPIGQDGSEQGERLVIESTDEALLPHLIVSKLKERDEHFTGSLPGNDGAYYVVTEPVRGQLVGSVPSDLSE